jgi:hypothetical protein
VGLSLRASLYGSFVVCAIACTKPAPPTPTQSTPSASVSAAATSAAPALVAEQSVPGLRVRSGTLAPRGASTGVVSPWGFSDLAVDLARARLELVAAPGGAPLAELLPVGALAIVNGGYFEADFRPSTWVVSGGVALSKKSDTSKGGVLALSGSQLFIGAFGQLRFEPSLAVQSFPLVVEADGKSGIHRDDARRRPHLVRNRELATRARAGRLRLPRRPQPRRRTFERRVVFARARRASTSAVRARRVRSRDRAALEQRLGAFEQDFSLILGRIVDDLVQERLQDTADVRPRLHADVLHQGAPVDG